MGLFEKIFGKKTEKTQDGGQVFRLLDGYVPAYSDFNGSIYESELIRTAVDAKARHISKLHVIPAGSAKPSLVARIEKEPNSLQTWSQFLYRLSTILDVKNTAFIAPLLNDETGEMVGYYPLCPVKWELRDVDGEPWLRFFFKDNKRAAIELARVGILTRYQYESDLFGSSNSALRDTLSLIKIQRQGIKEYSKNANSYRFYAQANNFVKPDDLVKERQRFSEQNFKSDGGGLLLFPNTYTSIKQIEPQNYVVNAGQSKLIQENVYSYFGVNSDVVQNKCYGDAFNAFYEGAIEPFAVQLSEVLTRMTFTAREQAFGAKIYLSANRLQYMSNTEKLSVSRDMVDRGIMSINEVREIWQLPPVDGGDRRVIRGEYKDSDTHLQEGEK